jgi:hypothetical protein
MIQKSIHLDNHTLSYHLLKIHDTFVQKALSHYPLVFQRSVHGSQLYSHLCHVIQTCHTMFWTWGLAFNISTQGGNGRAYQWKWSFHSRVLHPSPPYLFHHPSYRKLPRRCLDSVSLRWIGGEGPRSFHPTSTTWQVMGPLGLLHPLHPWRFQLSNDVCINCDVMHELMHNCKSVTKHA